VLVDGVQCPREHFNDPAARACRQCGAGLEQPPRHVRRAERPPLGVLVMDDGARITLNRDYVLGREPALDGDVMAGRAKPLRISDPEGTVSRLHLRISLVGWQVEVTDLGSANGSVIQSPGGEQALAPFEPTVVEPGAWIGVGHRSMQYLAYQGVLP
jgi:pSer/pThr/pTyr-binding forkhead associated (FHA) protein